MAYKIALPEIPADRHSRRPLMTDLRGWNPISLADDDDEEEGDEEDDDEDEDE